MSAGSLPAGDDLVAQATATMVSDPLLADQIASAWRRVSANIHNWWKVLPTPRVGTNVEVRASQVARYHFLLMIYMERAPVIDAEARCWSPGISPAEVIAAHRDLHRSIWGEEYRE